MPPLIVQSHCACNFTELGALYAKRTSLLISSFFTKEFGSSYAIPRYIERSAPLIKKFAPSMYEFCKGASSNSSLTLAQHILLLFHEEELYHRRLRTHDEPHCTVVGLRSPHAKKTKVTIGQNWDWSTSYFPYVQLCRFITPRSPAITALSFPGLPVCAGINAAGLSLMWTGVGYYPVVSPEVGVPTYALVFELLQKKSVEEAMYYLRSLPRSGSFAFLLGDRRGDLAIIEATPGTLAVECVSPVFRANLYELSPTMKDSRQKLPPTSHCHSRKRIEILARSLTKASRIPFRERMKFLLQLNDIRIERPHHATLMQLIADCTSGTLRYRALGSATWKSAS